MLETLLVVARISPLRLALLLRHNLGGGLNNRVWPSAFQVGRGRCPEQDRTRRLQHRVLQKFFIAN